MVTQTKISLKNSEQCKPQRYSREHRRRRRRRHQNVCNTLVHTQTCMHALLYPLHGHRGTQIFRQKHEILWNFIFDLCVNTTKNFTYVCFSWSCCFKCYCCNQNSLHFCWKKYHMYTGKKQNKTCRQVKISFQL